MDRRRLSYLNGYFFYASYVVVRRVSFFIVRLMFLFLCVSVCLSVCLSVSVLTDHRPA